MALANLLGSVLSADESNSSADLVSDARATAEALAGALAIAQVNGGSGVAHAAEAFLQEQTLLLQSQREEIAEVRGLRVAQLRGQVRESRMRYVAHRFRALLLGAALLILIAVTSGFGVMVWEAATSRSVVIDTFTAPSTLAARGLSGTFVASGVLDALQKLQAATRLRSVGFEARGAWSNDIKIEVPRTGISIGDVSRLLHDAFAHDMHVGGDLTESLGGQLTLTVRGTGIPASSFVGSPADLDALTVRAAEYVYGRVQPWRYSSFLLDAGRNADAIAFLPGALARAKDDMERANLFNTWGDALPSPQEGEAAAEKFRLAMALARPRSAVWWTAWSNAIEALWDNRGEEAAWRESEAFSEAASNAPNGERPRQSLFNTTERILWEPSRLLRSLLTNLGGNSSLTSPVDPVIADVEEVLHDPEQAALYIALSDPRDDTTRAEAAFLEGSAALMRGDPAAAVSPFLAFDRIWLGNPLLQSNEPDQPCFLGLAYGLSGDLARAAGAFDQVSNPWARCWAFRGDVLAQAGDVAGARQAWATGIRLLPDLPNVYLARGTWEMRQGDDRAAAADLSTASAKAPRFADPLKAWGDLLAREGRWAEALSRYEVAITDAPRWAALRDARRVVLGHIPGSE